MGLTITLVLLLPCPLQAEPYCSVGGKHSFRKVPINPLLQYDRNKVTSLSIDKEAFNLTFVIAKNEPLTVWFQSLLQMNIALAEWDSTHRGAGDPGM